MRKDVDKIIANLIKQINPYDITAQALGSFNFTEGKKILISIGKAAYDMAKAVSDNLDIDYGAVITKYGHSKGEIDNIKIFEAGHPIVDENSIKATDYVLNITSDLNENDNVIFLISGGGSALFEKPLVPLSVLQDINDQLLKSGANINEINTIRKRLSSVKAGKFAMHARPAHIYSLILSDVLGNDLSTIASGPIFNDITTSKQALDIIDRYNIKINDEVRTLLNKDSVNNIDNVEYKVIGSVSVLCEYTKTICESLGYKMNIVDDKCVGEARYVGRLLASYASDLENNSGIIMGGETTVTVKGNGLGGRNSELALASSKYLKGIDNCCVFAFGSDGTDGPTDAAGGYVDSKTCEMIDVDYYLDNNDAYNGLKKTGGLIITGPTGSNINDVYVLLKKGE